MTSPVINHILMRAVNLLHGIGGGGSHIDATQRYECLSMARELSELAIALQKEKQNDVKVAGA